MANRGTRSSARASLLARLSPTPLRASLTRPSLPTFAAFLTATAAASSTIETAPRRASRVTALTPPRATFLIAVYAPSVPIVARISVATWGMVLISWKPKPNSSPNRRAYSSRSDCSLLMATRALAAGSMPIKAPIPTGRVATAENVLMPNCCSRSEKPL